MSANENPIPSETNAAPAAGRKPARFWARLNACFLDMIIFVPVYALVLQFAYNYPNVGGMIVTVLAIAYYAWFFTWKWQATPGMRFTKVYATSADGSRLSFAHAFIWGLVSVFFLFICMAAIFYVQMKYDIVEMQRLSMTDPAGEKFQEFSKVYLNALGVFALLLLFWAMTIIMPKNKVGLHNKLAKVRFWEGRVHSA